MQHKKKVTLYASIGIVVLLFTAGLPCSSAQEFHAIKGGLYINGVAAPALTRIDLAFPSVTYQYNTSPMNQGYNYIFNFQGHEGETGNFSVLFQNQWYTPIDNATVNITFGVIGYHRDLYITVFGGGNIPPFADAGGPYVAQVNTPVTFTGAGSYDLDGTVEEYRWDWTNDGVFDTGWLTTPNTTYTYSTLGDYIVALQVKDNEGGVGNDTATVTITTTPPLNQPPDPPSDPTPQNYATNQSVFADLTWTGGDPDAGDTIWYNVSFGTMNPPVFYGVAGPYGASQALITFSLPQLNFGTQYYWQITAMDNHGASTQGPVWTFTTIALGVDTQPPSKVTGLTVTDQHDGKLLLAWDPATDNYGVDHYTIYRDAVFLANATATAYQDSGLVNGVTYTYRVSAVDTSGNEGEQSDPASGTPTQSPSGPGPGPGPGPANIPPVADAGGPYQRYVGESILFNGSQSYDDDGTITSWQWTFGDGGNGTGETIAHTYTTAGVFTVMLTVIDDQGAMDTNITTATITTPDQPPTAPSITGPRIGVLNTSYTYMVMSTDPENSTLQYAFDWGDSPIGSWSEPYPSGDTITRNHTWTTAGVFQMTVLVRDTLNQTTSTSVSVLISCIYVGDLGYLIDHDGDGIYDAFYSNATLNETAVEYQADGTYLIDTDGDGVWDYLYDPVTKQLTAYGEQQAAEEGTGMSWWILAGLLGGIIILLLALLILLRKKTPPATSAPPPTNTPPPPAPAKPTETASSKKPRKSTKK